MTALKVQDISIRFGGIVALSDVSFEVERGEIFALIGPNGAGKTTLFNVVTGVYTSDGGQVFLSGEDVTGVPSYRLAQKGLTRTFQNLQIFSRMTAVENVMVGFHIHERRSLLSDFLGLPSVHRQTRESRRRAGELLDQVGLSGRHDVPASELPYGALKRLEIARALALRPSVVMLDEPAAGCNTSETAEVADVISMIAKAGAAVVIVEHDMSLVMRIADRIHVLDRGRTLATGGPDEIRSNPAVIEAYLGTPTKPEGPHAAH